MKRSKGYKQIVTTHQLGKYIIEIRKCPTPVYHGKGYKEAKRNKVLKFWGDIIHEQKYQRLY